MIIGFGSDLCSIDRIQSSLDRFGQRFIDRVFTDIEQAKASRRELTRAGTYAKRFAAKEACAKALGTGFRAGVFFRDMGVVNDPSGRSEEHTSELQSLMRISYAVFCLKKKKTTINRW